MDSEQNKAFPPPALALHASQQIATFPQPDSYFPNIAMQCCVTLPKTKIQTRRKIKRCRLLPWLCHICSCLVPQPCTFVLRLHNAPFHTRLSEAANNRWTIRVDGLQCHDENEIWLTPVKQTHECNKERRNKQTKQKTGRIITRKWN